MNSRQGVLRALEFKAADLISADPGALPLSSVIHPPVKTEEICAIFDATFKYGEC